MEHTWRWFGPQDPITLEELRQTGATGVVTALHEIPNGAVWPREMIRARREMIEAAGLNWSVVESVPVHEAIKQGRPERDEFIEAYRRTLRHLAAEGIDTVCYNFMPVLDWTRTELAWPLPGGGDALRFDQRDFAVFELCILARPGAEEQYSSAEIEQARRRYAELDEPARGRLLATLVKGLPGAEEGYTLDQLRAALAAYEHIDGARLREHLGHFIRAVAPLAESLGMRLCIHPDDPPRPLLGLPRVLSTAADVDWLFAACASPANGLTFCTGSFGVRADNRLAEMVARFAARIHFVHLRATRRDVDEPRSFTEAPHLDGDVDMVAVIGALLDEERRREREGGARLPVRPDHGHRLLDDLTRASAPGYPLIGRLKGLAELRGVERAVRALTNGRNEV